MRSFFFQKIKFPLKHWYFISPIARSHLLICFFPVEFSIHCQSSSNRNLIFSVTEIHIIIMFTCGLMYWDMVYMQSKTLIKRKIQVDNCVVSLNKNMKHISTMLRYTVHTPNKGHMYRIYTIQKANF